MGILDVIASWSAVPVSQPEMTVSNFLLLVFVSLFSVLSRMLARYLSSTNQKVSGLWTRLFVYGLNTIVWVLAGWFTPTCYGQFNAPTFAGRDTMFFSLCLKKVQYNPYNQATT